MRLKFALISDAAMRAKLECFDFDEQVAEQLAVDLLQIADAQTDVGSIHIEFEYDPNDENRVVGYSIPTLPPRTSKPGNA
jgi:hypothetical protein